MTALDLVSQLDGYFQDFAACLRLDVDHLDRLDRPGGCDCGRNLAYRGHRRVQAEFGTRTGDVGSVLYVGGPRLDDATAQESFALAWGHMQNGANGLAALENIAGGPGTFTGNVVTWADSLDSLMAASAENFADPEVQEQIASSGIQVLGRVLTRRLF